MSLDYLPICVLSLMSGFSGWDGDWKPSFLSFYYLSGSNGLIVEWAGVAGESLERKPLCELMKNCQSQVFFPVNAIYAMKKIFA